MIDDSAIYHQAQCDERQRIITFLDIRIDHLSNVPNASAICAELLQIRQALTDA